MFGGTGSNANPDGSDEFDGGADVDQVSYANRLDALVADRLTA